MRAILSGGAFFGLSGGLGAGTPRLDPQNWPGAHPAWSAFVFQPGTSTRKLKQLKPNSIPAMFRHNGMLDMRTCGQPGSPPCDTGSTVSSISQGLSGTLWDWAKSVVTPTPEVKRDDAGNPIYTEEDLARDKATMEKAKSDEFIALDAEAKKAQGLVDAANPLNEHPISPWIKVAVIGGVSLAGLVALGYVYRSFK